MEFDQFECNPFSVLTHNQSSRQFDMAVSETKHPRVPGESIEDNGCIFVLIDLRLEMSREGNRCAVDVSPSCLHRVLIFGFILLSLLFLSFSLSLSLSLSFNSY